MGIHSNISYDKFPAQGSFLGRNCRVVFNYGTIELKGKIIRNDLEEPFITIIQLEDGRCVLSTECQYSPDSK